MEQSANPLAPADFASVGAFRVRKARVSDAHAIHRLISLFSEKGNMLRRTLGQIYETIQEFAVAEDAGQVVGCAALHIDCAELAEVRSVAVDPGYQGKGVGRLLIEALLEEGKRLEVANVFCLTDKPRYFEKFGFLVMDKSDLPHKIWRDCVNCPAFPDCRETALIHPLANPEAVFHGLLMPSPPENCGR